MPPLDVHGEALQVVERVPVGDLWRRTTSWSAAKAAFDGSLARARRVSRSRAASRSWPTRSRDARSGSPGLLVDLVVAVTTPRIEKDRAVARLGVEEAGRGGEALRAALDRRPAARDEGVHALRL
jgi:hypothetical protein